MTASDSLPVPESFLREANELGVNFAPGEIEKLGRYLALLLEANQRINLTAVTEPEEAWRKHILDSLTLLAILSEGPGGSRIADVGAGGGAPGLPLAIVMPRAHFTLIEATGKKAAFLTEAATALELSNVVVVSDRAETLGQDHKQFRAQYDYVLARAVGRISVVAELTIPLTNVGGQVLLIKGAKADEELAEAKQALHRLHTSCAGVIETPTGKIVVLEKLRETPRLYPRRPGEPKRSPLG